MELDITKALKMVMLDKKIKQYEAAEILGMDKRPYNRLIQKGDDLKMREVTKIADGLNCDVKLIFVDRETGKEWLCDKN